MFVWEEQCTCLLFTHSLGSPLATSNWHILWASADMTKTTLLQLATDTFKCTPHLIHQFKWMQSEAALVTLTLNRQTYSISQKIVRHCCSLSLTFSYPVLLAFRNDHWPSVIYRSASQRKSSTTFRFFEFLFLWANITRNTCNQFIENVLCRVYKGRYSKSDHMSVKIWQQQE